MAGNRSRRGDCSRLEACTTRNSHPLGYVKTAVILARRQDRERLQRMFQVVFDVSHVFTITYVIFRICV